MRPVLRDSLPELRDPLSLSHQYLSQQLLLPALRMQQFLRSSRRPVALARRRALAFRTKSAAWDEQRKREWILQQLRATLRDAAGSTAYYADLFAGLGFDPNADFSFDDFACLPALEKSDIRSGGDRLLSRAVVPDQRISMTSGGSTGVPVTVWVGPEDQGWGMAGVEQQMESLGAPLGCRTAQFWGHNLDTVASDNIVDRLSSLCSNRRWIDCFRLSPEHLAHAHVVLEGYRPDCIVAYASALGALAEHVLERGSKAGYPSRCFVTGAEKARYPSSRGSVACLWPSRARAIR
jgi:phenylacetate-coenzyme A ligase PaaK-like adenylate-forming protein